MMDPSYRHLLEKTQEYALEYLDQAASAPPYPGEEALSRLEQLDPALPAKGEDPQTVLKTLHTLAGPATTQMIGGRFFGFVNGGLLPAAHAAEWLADTWNQNTALYAMSPAVSKLEELCEHWVTELLGLPSDTAMGLVTGSSNALICALAAARNELLHR